MKLPAILMSLVLISPTQSRTQGYYPQGGPDTGPEEVSMIQLIANPQSYDGKRIRLIGFLHLEFEGDAIYMHRKDFDASLTKDALWVNVPKDMTSSQIKTINDHYVICTGIFRAAMHGHMGLNSGEIDQTTRLEVWR